MQSVETMFTLFPEKYPILSDYKYIRWNDNVSYMYSLLYR